MLEIHKDCDIQFASLIKFYPRDEIQFDGDHI